MYLPENLTVDWDEIEHQRQMYEKLRLGDFYIEEDDWLCAEVAAEREGAYSIHDGFFIRNDGERFHAIIVVYRFKADAAIYYTELHQTIDCSDGLIYDTFQEEFEPIGDNGHALQGIKQWCAEWISDFQ